ncbi:MAG: CGGC domain-containing protein [Desulfobacterales bacterium]|jgi:predicted metal-binding protein
MPKIGILGCDVTTRDMDCVMIGCFGNLRGRQGEFEQYSETDPPELVGIISCGGCPTAFGTDRIWQKVKALKEYGIEAVHLTSCLVQVCPHKDDFVKTIQKEYPDIKVVEGTHPFHDLDVFRSGIKELSSQRAAPPQKMNDLVFKRIKIHTDEDE